MTNTQLILPKYLLSLSATLSLLPAIANAQLIPDNTLGKENSIVNSVNSLQKQIDGGAIRGSNLFHSFKEFNIGGGNSVYFSNPTAIQNILTRVTGNNASGIFGKLGVLGNANLFLINPSGIIFGENASLDISGSFTATTSPSILFDNGLEFSATNPQAVPLLKVNLTPGLQLGGNQQEDISNQGNLTVGEDLTLIGKNLNLTGSLEAGKNLKLEASDSLIIRDSANKPFIANAGNDLLLQGNQIVDIFALNNSDSGLFSGNDLILRSANPVLGDADYFSDGNFRIEQLDGTLGGLSSPNDPIIRASGDVSFESYTGASLHILAGGSVNISGDVTITGADGASGLEETVSVASGENLEINGKTQATLDIRAGTTGFATTGITGGGSFTPTNPNTGGSATSSDIFIGGNIRVDAADGLVFLSNQYQPNNNLSGGNIQITGDIDTSSTNGNGGRIFIDSKSDISTSGFLSSTSTEFNGGAITFNAAGNIDITGIINSDGKTKAGNIDLEALGNLKISNTITANSSTGSAGNISLSSGNTLNLLNDAFINSKSSSDNPNETAIQGGIQLIAPSIILDDGSEVTVNIDGWGKAGDLIVEATDIKILDGSGLNSFTEGLGDAGDINITTERLLIQNNNPNPDSINVSNFDEFRTGISTFVLKLPQNTSPTPDDFESGQGGNITINASESVELIGNQPGAFSPKFNDELLISFFETSTGIATGTTGSGDAGNLSINTGDLILKDGAGITTSSISPASLSTVFPDLIPSLIDNLGLPSFLQNTTIEQINSQLLNINSAGKSGELIVNASEIQLIGKGGFTSATLSSADAGNLTINNTNEIILENGAAILAGSLGSGNAGNLQINTNAISVRDGSLIGAGTADTGEGGELILISPELVELVGTAPDTEVVSSIITLARENSTGNAGALTIETKNLVIEDKAEISASTSSTKGGDITLRELNTLEMSNGKILASTVDGDAGSIKINATDSINLFNGSVISSEATGDGAAGNLRFSSDSILIDNQSKLTSETTIGISGNISLENLKTLQITGDSTLSATTVDGEAGDITINASSEVKVENASTIASGAVGRGEAGLLNIITDKLTISDASRITVSSLETGDSGLISIQASDVNLTNGARISANTESGDGDGITLFGLTSLSLNNSEISASTTDGVAGNININATNLVQLEAGSKLASEATGNNEGAAGDIDIITNQLTINNSQVNVSSKANGIAGSVLINASDVLLSNQSQIAATTEQSSFEGNITLEKLNTLELSNSRINASTIDAEAGDININAADSVKLTDGSTIASEATSSGKAGELTIFTNQLTMTNSEANVSNKGSGDAGDIFIDARDVNLSENARILAKTVSGDGDGITLFGLTSLSLNNSEISASTTDGVAGDININATNLVQLEAGSKLASEATGNDEGVAGNIDIITNQFTINDNSQVNVSSKANGNAGRVLVNASDILLTNQSQIAATTEQSGIEVNITLDKLNTLELLNSRINASTVDAEAGDIYINAADSVKLADGSTIASESTGSGQAGELTILTNQLTMTNSQVNVSSKNDGIAGDVFIDARDVNLSENARILAKTVSGDGDGITLFGLTSLTLNNSEISASTTDGIAGDININDTNLVQLEAGSKLASEATGSGEAGELTIFTNQLTMTNSQVNVSSKNDGIAGDVFIDAKDVNLSENAKISANTVSGIGDGITLFGLTSLTLDNSEISASTTDGVAGDISINATESIKFTGKGGLSVQATEGGIAGSVTVNTSQFNISNEAEVNVSSRLGQAGNLDITADNLFLTQAKLTAETGVGEGLEGANITLNIKDLLWMQDESLISAEAFDIANGGNITINNSQGFVIGLRFENSDISANATEGNGGNIDITSQNIFGLVFRDKKTSYSDITASSKFGVNGEVTVNELSVNTAANLTELPNTFVGTTGIKAGCSASKGNNFIISGRGGLPQNPYDLFSGKTTYTDLFDLLPIEKPSSKMMNENSSNNLNTENQKNQIVEATGWVKDSDGNVIFVAKMPEKNHQKSRLSQVDCESFSAVNQ